MDTNIYFVKSGRHVKIGHAHNVKTRLSAIQLGSPEPVELLGFMARVPVETEKKLHAQFAAAHRGGEWFQLTPEIKAFIKENCRGQVVDGRSIRPRKMEVQFSINVAPEIKDGIAFVAKRRGATIKSVVAHVLQSLIEHDAREGGYDWKAAS